MLINDDCLLALKSLSENSIDSLVTDPPAGISFMGKDWDKDKGGREPWIAWMTQVMEECFRVMKPGAHGLVWAIPRTSHWTATSLENAGFEVRDVVTHLFGSGFPKSLDISKAIDKAAGATREITGYAEPLGREGRSAPQGKGLPTLESDGYSNLQAITAPATDSAKQWQGWGTALKPASEHWILVRKPCSEKTVAANVLKHGVGGINIDRCRIGTNETLTRPGVNGFNANSNYANANREGSSCEKNGGYADRGSVTGRFPANLLLSHTLFCEGTCTDDCPARLLDEQVGHLAGGKPSRFFYVAKASKRDRNEGLEGMPEKAVDRFGECGQGTKPQQTPRVTRTEVNHHPTVKPTKLMEYLITLVTPPGGTVLDPFMGSGSTGKAAKKLGFEFIGIEKEPGYFEIAQRRINA